MPPVRIDLIGGRPEAGIVAVGKAVHRALADRMNVRERDHFQDVIATLARDTPEDWSFSHGLARYLELASDRWK